MSKSRADGQLMSKSRADGQLMSKSRARGRLMQKCRSWRFLGAPDDAERYFPVGKHHDVWRPCTNRVPRGTRRCRECQDALIACPQPRIRRALAAEVNQDAYVLQALSSDNDPIVAAAAQRLLNSVDAIWEGR